MTYDSLRLHLSDHPYISYNEDIELTNFNPHTTDVILSLIGTLKNHVYPKNVIDGDNKSVLLEFCDKINNLRLLDMILIASPNAVRRVVKREKEDIQKQFDSIKYQLQSMNSTFNNETREIINQILNGMLLRETEID